MKIVYVTLNHWLFLNSVQLVVQNIFDGILQQCFSTGGREPLNKGRYRLN